MTEARPALQSANWKLVCRAALSEGVPRRSLWVALCVGTILNLINQGDVVFSGRRLDIGKLALTYIVPYLVSTYGAVSFRLHAVRESANGRAAAAAKPKSERRS